MSRKNINWRPKEWNRPDHELTPREIKHFALFDRLSAKKDDYLDNPDLLWSQLPLEVKRGNVEVLLLDWLRCIEKDGNK